MHDIYNATMMSGNFHRLGNWFTEEIGRSCEGGKLFPSKLFPLRAFGALVAVVLFAAIVPYVEVRVLAGDSWRGILPELVGDAQFYISRAMVVSEGYIFGSNPYFLEHIGEQFPSTPFPDMLAALPFFLGFPPLFAVLLNFFLWCLVYVSLLFLLLKSLGISSRGSVIGASLILLGTYSYVLRQTSMQIYLPVYVLFLLLLSEWLAKRDFRLASLLGSLVGGTVFVYPHLFVLVASTWAVIFVHLFVRRREHLPQYFWASACAALFVVPFAIFAFFGAKDQFYHETLLRYAPLFSHLPQIEEYYYGRWILVGVTMCIIFRKSCADNRMASVFDFLLICGTGILLALVSSNITGVDFENATHVGRFAMFWVFLSVVIVFFCRTPLSRDFFGKRLFLRIVALGLFFLLALEAVLSLPRSLQPLNMSREVVLEVESYSGVFDWLSAQGERSVVLASERMSGYIPIETGNPILFNRYGLGYFASNREIEERWLLSRFPSPVDIDLIERSANDFWSGGKLFYTRNAELWFSVCKKLTSGERCISPPPTYNDADHSRFREMEKEYREKILVRPAESLRAYHVRFVVVPNAQAQRMEEVVAWSMVYADQYFTVYEVPGAK